MQDNRLGKIGNPLPPDFVHNLQIKDYLASEFTEGSRTEIVGKDGCIGRSWRFGPIHFEQYNSDQEPIITKAPYARIIFWRPFTKTEVPLGWRRDWMASELIKQSGFTHIKKDKSYFADWSQNAKQDRNKWLNRKEFEIVRSDYSTFLREYPQNGNYKKIRAFTLGNVKRKIRFFGTLVHFFAAQHIESGKISAMVVLIDLSQFNKAYYLTAFVKPEATHALVATGLIDYCFRYCVDRNISFLDFGCFWTPGSPSSWKGFSRFKQKFGVTLIRYPRPLWKFVRSNHG